MYAISTLVVRSSKIHLARLSDSCTRKRTQCREPRSARFPHAQANFIRLQVDKAHVAAPNWPTKDILVARLSERRTLKRADTNSAQTNSFLLSF